MYQSQKPKPEKFGASHGPQQPQYFLVIMLGRRIRYVENEI